MARSGSTDAPNYRPEDQTYDEALNVAPGTTYETQNSALFDPSAQGATSTTGKDDWTGWQQAGAFFGLKPTPQSEFTAQALPIGNAPQVGDAPQLSAQQIAAQGQDWSGRYGTDYDTAFQAQNDLAAQRQYMQQVQTGQAGPSLAELQLGQGLQQAQGAALGNALAGRGGAGAQIAAVRGGYDAALQTNAAAAQARAAEQMAARDQVAGLLGQEQAGAAGLAGITAGQAGLEQGWAGQALTAEQANQAAALSAAQANQAAWLDAQKANQTAWLDARGIEADTYNASLAANAEIARANLEAQSGSQKQNKGGFLSGIGGAAGMLLGG